ncbi:MAG: hypothetical protein ACXAC5_04065 [Promethearchaeota archaeon]
MWLLTIVITVATVILYHFLKNNIRLGVKALMTWGTDSIAKLHDENGRVKTIFWTFAMFFVGTHVLHLVVLWVGTITWTLGIWNPHS